MISQKHNKGTEYGLGFRPELPESLNFYIQIKVLVLFSSVCQYLMEEVRYNNILESVMSEEISEHEGAMSGEVSEGE